MSGRQGGPATRDCALDERTTGSDAGSGTADEIASVDRAIAALEAQRDILGDAVVDTALDPLRARRAELEASRTEQRRLVTVVFADLVDFTVLSRQLDAEDTREVVNAYFARWQRAIEDHGGVVEKFIGDAVMAVFGLSRSFEDDAHRAIRSSLAMLADLDDLNADLVRRFGVTLHMRVGIDTGEVVVSTLGERAGGGFVAVGPTVNRASRIQAAAPVDRVLISSDTQRLVRGVFDVEAPTSLHAQGHRRAGGGRRGHQGTPARVPARPDRGRRGRGDQHRRAGPGAALPPGPAVGRRRRVAVASGHGHG